MRVHPFVTDDRGIKPIVALVVLAVITILVALIGAIVLFAT